MTDIVIEQDLKFASLDAFKEYNKLVMGSESFDVYMTGKTKIHQSGLKAISVDYNKKVTMKGKSGSTCAPIAMLTNTRSQQAQRPQHHRPPNLRRIKEAPSRRHKHGWLRPNSESLRHDP